jgi:NDP-sugar pyrophosphorylase family protein
VKALILAAGLGTRLKSLTSSMPKPMLPVAGRPLLEHSIELLRSYGVSEIAINLHFQPDVIVSHFGDGSGFGVKLVYSREDRLLGTAGAAKRLELFLDQPFYVLYGDVLTDVDLSVLAARHCARQAALSMVLYRVEDPMRAGIVDMAADGRVRRFREKPSAVEVFSDLASAGVFVVEPAVLASIPPATFFDFGHDVIPQLLVRGSAVYGWWAPGYVMDIGSLERYRQAELDARAGRVRLSSLAMNGRAGPRDRKEAS